MSSDDRKAAREMATKIGGTVALVLVLAGMASHPLPGSIDSLLRGLGFGIPGGLVAGVTAGLVVRARRRNRSGVKN
jgi:hypothetical protein